MKRTIYSYVPPTDVREILRIDNNGTLWVGGKEIYAVLVDIEGNAIDTNKHHHISHRRVAEKVGVRVDPHNYSETIAIAPSFFSGPDPEIMAEIYKHSNKSLRPDEMLALDKKWYREALERDKHLRPRSGVEEFLRAMREIGLHVGFVSNTPRDEAKHLLEHTGLWKYASHGGLITVREDVKHPKPHPEPWKETALKIGTHTHHVLALDDTANGIKSAKEAGCVCIAMPVNPTEQQVTDLLDKGARAVLSDWTLFRPGLNGYGRHQEGHRRGIEGRLSSRERR